MAQDGMASIVDRFRLNIRDAGIALDEKDFGTIIEGGYLRPVLAFEQAVAEVGAEKLPDYLGIAEVEEHGTATAAATSPAVSKLGIRAAGPTGGPLDLPLHEAAALVKKGELSPLDLARASLARMAERDGLLNVFQLVLREEALAAARVAEAEIRSGAYRGPLHGLPLAVKDILDLAGSPTTAGSKILADRVATTDSTAIARLRKAGALIIGKTRMSEFAYSPGSNNDHYGPTRNPANLERDTGGSSSGSAAAVADHLVYASLGTDTGGSIRIPAAFCGLVGLKPTQGLLSLQGSVSLSWSLDHLGPLAREVLDLALLLDALAGHDPLDPRTRRDAPRGGYAEAALRGREGLAGLRVGVLRDDGSGRALANEPALAAWRRGLAALEAQGASLVEVDLVELQGLRTLNSAILAMEGVTSHLPTLRTRLADYGDFMRLRFLAGLAHGPVDFIRAEQARGILRRRSEGIFGRVDILSTPTMPAEAPALGTPPRLTFTAPFNLLGWPALTLPVGVTVDGLPLGMQLVARPWDEGTVLRAALAAEQALR